MKKKDEIKVCLVGSSGGHLTHLYMLKPFWKDKNRFWVTFDKEDARSLLEGEKVYPCYFPTNRSIKALINSINYFRDDKLVQQAISDMEKLMAARQQSKEQERGSTKKSVLDALRSLKAKKQEQPAQEQDKPKKAKKKGIILHESGAFVTQTALGFDGEAARKMRAFLQDPKPELLHHQKFFENGTAERAKESGTEQNYNMIDGCVNNMPKKPRRIGGRWSVLDRLHIKQAERRQKDNAPQQEQERSRKN